MSVLSMEAHIRTKQEAKTQALIQAVMAEVLRGKEVTVCSASVGHQERLQQRFREAGLNPDNPLITWHIPKEDGT